MSITTLLCIACWIYFLHGYDKEQTKKIAKLEKELAAFKETK